MRNQQPQVERDEVWNIQQVARFLGFKESRARKNVARAGITPVRTHQGIGYMSSDVRAMANQIRSHWE